MLAHSLASRGRYSTAHCLQAEKQALRVKLRRAGKLDSFDESSSVSTAAAAVPVTPPAAPQLPPAPLQQQQAESQGQPQREIAAATEPEARAAAAPMAAPGLEAVATAALLPEAKEHIADLASAQLPQVDSSGADGDADTAGQAVPLPRLPAAHPGTAVARAVQPAAGPAAEQLRPGGEDVSVTAQQPRPGGEPSGVHGEHSRRIAAAAANSRTPATPESEAAAVAVLRKLLPWRLVDGVPQEAASSQRLGKALSPEQRVQEAAAAQAAALTRLAAMVDELGVEKRGYLAALEALQVTNGLRVPPAFGCLIQHQLWPCFMASVSCCFRCCRGTCAGSSARAGSRLSSNGQSTPCRNLLSATGRRGITTSGSFI